MKKTKQIPITTSNKSKKIKKKKTKKSSIEKKGKLLSLQPHHKKAVTESQQTIRQLECII